MRDGGLGVRRVASLALPAFVAGVLADRALVESQMNSPLQQASFLAASSSHSGDWLFALPIASCGLRLDDEAVRVAVGIRLGLPICVPHQRQCGELVCIRHTQLRLQTSFW